MQPMHAPDAYRERDGSFPSVEHSLEPFSTQSVNKTTEKIKKKRNLEKKLQMDEEFSMSITDSKNKKVILFKLKYMCVAVLQSS